MAIPEDFPTFFKYYSTNIKYSNDVQRAKLVTEVADRVSSIFAFLLTKDGHFKTKSEMDRAEEKENYFLDVAQGKTFDNTEIDSYPSSEEIAYFRNELKDLISNNLSQKNGEARLSIDTIPEGEFYKTLVKSGIKCTNYKLSRFFPQNNTTRISMKKKCM